jgi:hypothetical protein
MAHPIVLQSTSISKEYVSYYGIADYSVDPPSLSANPVIFIPLISYEVLLVHTYSDYTENIETHQY